MREALQNIIKKNKGKICIHLAELVENTEYIPFTEKNGISWHQVECLTIVSRNRYTVEIVPAEEILRGIYISYDNSWALIYTDDIVGFSPIIARCADHLTTLYIHGDITEDIDVSPCEKMESLVVQNDFLRVDTDICVRGIQNLQKIKELKLDEVRFDDGMDLSRMTDLEILELKARFHSKSRLSVNGVQKAKKLKELFIAEIAWGYQLDLSELTELRKLSLYDGMPSGNHYGGVTGVENLTQLTRLELCCDLRGSSLNVSRLENLESFYVSRNKNLTSVIGLERLQKLEHLGIRDTGIRHIPEGIRQLTRLKRLILTELELDELPNWLPELRLTFSTDYFGPGISLKDTKVRDVDMRIFDQPQDVILQWFKGREAGSARPLNEVKVVFLGDGEAGKTHTIARLLNNGEKPKPEDFDGKATPGIVIQNKKYDLDGQKIQVHFWDFGGQEILHSMHRMFLTERTLYVVIINARDDTQDDRARYWLHNIKSFAGTAPVLLVLNKIDQNPNASIDLPGLQKMYEGLKQVVRMSALEYDAERFNKVFTAALMKQVKDLGTHGEVWPASWLKLKNGLENMQTNYIHGCDYEDLCEESGVEESDKKDIREDLLRWFNDLGVSFCYSGSSRLEDYVILKPEWLTNAIYIILFNKCEEAKNGIVPHRAINRMLKKPRKGQDEIRRVKADFFYNPQEVDYVMDVIRKFRLSYKVREDAEFIPVLCQRESMDVAEEYAAAPDTLEFTMDYEYLPDNVIHRLMVEMRNDLDTENVWRTGARFVQAGTGFSAVVRSEGNMLHIFVRSDNPMHKPNTYLHIIKGNIDRINAEMELQEPFCEVVYKDNGVTESFDYEDLLNAMKDGDATYRSKKLRRKIPIQDILNQSGRTAEVELDKLRDDIITACIQLQGNRMYWDTDEDNRNTAVRDALRNMGHLVNDQTFQGVGGGQGVRAGELDLEIRLDPKMPWTVCEALNVRGRENSVWDPHLNKLLDNYNPNGTNYLFLLTYVECDRDTFLDIWNHFRDHIRWFDPVRGKYERLPASFSDIPLHKHNDPNYIRAAKITYDRAGSPTTVCHIFARMGR